MTNVTVIVPSYRRPDDLRRCLSALIRQQLPPTQVVIVARDVDESTHTVAKAFAERLPLEVVIVSEPGQVYALNAGLSRIKGDIVAITDDDAAPHDDWLARIAAHFEADSRIGGVGGRDWIHTPEGTVVDSKKGMVGRVQWFGRIVGNHHVGTGPAREVDILKGANMSFRRVAIEGLHFDTYLRGQGAQLGNDMCFSMAVKRCRWKLIYDPAVAVDHYPALRFDADQRGAFNPKVTENSAFNMMWATQTQLAGWRRFATRQWQIWMGTRHEPGLLRAFHAWITSDEEKQARFAAARRGRRDSVSAIGAMKR
ncbi:glycosyltransferase family 2 protein [Candidatus Igneacidithiobacillus taiwanensis]|uniref:glycosyltransferase family 2 protein n=1 Tax=Candidatus Igneacidithiobacillus taiwanensis TaxID=1945924 RepID=UPI00289DDA05|nr:glycosyltransferase family 2 protein [Candidatus Igneacidithiobacillus taiwanensis]